MTRRDRTREVFRDVRDIAPVTRGLGALWLAGMGVTLNGLAASALFDQAGGGASLAQGTAASQPVVVPGAIGARTALRFDGSTDFLARAITSGLNASARGLSCAFVAQGLSGSSGDYPCVATARAWTAGLETGWAICCNGTSVSGFISAHFADGATGFDHGSASAQASRGLSLTHRELWCVVFDGVAQRLRYYRNGTLDSELAPSWPSGSTTTTAVFQLGRSPTPAATRILAMDLYALAVHTEPLTAGEVQTYAARWMPLYGVTP